MSLKQVPEMTSFPSKSAEFLARYPILWFLDLDTDKDNLTAMIQTFAEFNPIAKFLESVVPADPEDISLVTANPQRNGDQYYRYAVGTQIWTFKINLLTDRFTFDLKQLESQFLGVNVTHSFDPETFAPLLESITNKVTEYQKDLAPKILSVLSNFIIALRSRDDSITFILSLTNVCLGLGIAQHLAMSAAASVVPHLKTIFGWMTRMESQNAVDSLVDYKELLMPIATIATVFGSLIMTMKLPDQKLIERVLTRLHSLGKGCQGFSNTMQFVEEKFSTAFNYVFERISGLPSGALECSKYIEEVEKYFLDIQSVLERSKFDELVTNVALCDEIDELYLRGLSYHQHMCSMKLTRIQMEPFLFHFRELTKLHQAVLRSGARAFGPRSEPVVVHLFGDSGVGKSGLTFLLAQDILVEEKLHHEVIKEIYMRQVEQEYWDAYHGQKVCVYDDFGQMRDGQSAPNKEYIEIIRTGNIVPMMCHMAAVEEKSRTPFTSKCLLLTSNLEGYDIVSLTYPEAFYRRRHVCAHVRTIEKFSKPSAAGRPVIDKEKVKDLPALTEDVYEFEIYNPITRKKTGEVLDYEQFAKRCREAYVEQHNRSEAIIDCLRKRAHKFDAPEFHDAPEGPILESQCNEIYDIANAVTAIWITARIKKGVIQAEVDLGTVPGFLRDKVDELVDIAMECETYEDFYGKVAAQVARELPQRNNYSYSNSILEFVKCYFEKGMSEVQSYAEAGFKIVSDYSSAPISLLKKLANSFKEGFRSALEALKESDIVKRALEWFSTWKMLCAAGTLMLSCGGLFAISRYFKKDVKEETFITESRVSGDAKTMKKPRFRTEKYDDGSTKAKRRMHTENNKPEIVSEACYDQTQRDIVNHSIMGNLFRLFFDDGDGLVPLVNCLFVRGGVALVPTHAISFINRKEFITFRNPHNQTGFKVSTKELNFYPVIAPDGQEKDASIMTVKSITKKDILRHFVKRIDLDKISSVRASLLTLFESKGSLHPREFAALKAVAQNRSKYVHRDPLGEEREVVVRSTYQYDCETIKGDCGSPLIAANESLVRKILGFHICGGHGIGVSVSISQEDISRALEQVPLKAQIGVEFGNDIVEQTDVTLPVGDFDPIGKLTTVLRTPPKTSLQESPLYGALLEPTTAPSALRPVNVDGNMVDPLVNGLKKCGTPPAVIPQNLMDAAVADMKSLIFKGSKDSIRRVLTHEESIVGIPGNELFAPINRRSSPGYPWTRKNKGIGKTQWLGDDDYILDNPELVRAIVDREQAARKGRRTQTLWVDTLKDERRPLEKVRIGKTRVFSAGPMDYIILYRKYFLAFNAHIMKNMIDNESAVGINVYSPSWHVLANYLKEKGPSVVAGDFSNFDGTLNDRILDAILDIINDWYDDGEENALVRTVLWKEIRSSIHVFEDNVYAWNHSQPSGNPGTVIINSLYNSISMRIVWNILTRNTAFYGMTNFRKHVNLITFGDDNVLNISNEAVVFFNQNTIAQAYSTIGMTYTNESKTESNVPFRSLDDVGFLKRAFRWDNEFTCGVLRYNLML